MGGGDASIVGANYTYTGAQARLWMGDNAGGSGLNIAAEYDYGLKISLAGISNAFNIKQYTGNVGIGTTSPTEKLSKTKITKRRRALAGLCHPDKGGSVEAMTKINQAADVLFKLV